MLVQVENEYGAYGSDKDYLRALAELLRGIGVTVPLTTVDQPAGPCSPTAACRGCTRPGRSGRTSPSGWPPCGATRPPGR